MVFWWMGYSFLHLDFGLDVSWTAKGHPKLWMLLDVMAESCSALAQWTYLHVLLLFPMRKCTARFSVDTGLTHS